MVAADRQMRRMQQQNQSQLDERTRALIATVEVVTRRFLQGLLTAHAKNQMFKVDADDEMTLLAAWNACEFIDACGFTVGAWYMEDAKVYLFTTTTSHTLGCQAAGHLARPWDRLPGAAATCPPQPQTEGRHTPALGLAGP